MNEKEGQGDAQRGKNADLGENFEVADQQQQKRAHRGQNRCPFRRPNLPGDLLSVSRPRLIQKQKIGQAQIHRKSQNRASETHRQNRHGIKNKRADEQGGYRPHGGGKQRQQADERPGKSKNQQQGDSERRQKNRQPRVAFGDGFVVQRRAIRADGRQAVGCFEIRAFRQIAPAVFQKPFNLRGTCRIRSRSSDTGDDKRVSAVCRKQLPLIKLCFICREQSRHLPQNNAGESQGISGHHVRPANPFQPAQALPVLRHGLTDFFRRQKRCNFLFQFRCAEKHGQVRGNIRRQLRKTGSLVTDADFGK